MLPVFQRVFGGIEISVAGLVYQIDHTAMCVLLVQKFSKGADGRFLLDRDNFVNSSCARQCERVQELMDAGCQMKVMRPPGGGFPCMHAKAYIVDGKVVLTGSVNLTHNGLEKNKEHLLEIHDSGTVAAILADFNTEWENAEVITPALMDRMKENHTKRDRSTRRSRSQSLSRSLSAELDTVAETETF